MKIFKKLSPLVRWICISAREIKEILYNSRPSVREWVGRRGILRAAVTLFRDLAVKDPDEYKKHVHMSIEKFEELLQLVESLITKKNTTVRNAMNVRRKLSLFSI